MRLHHLALRAADVERTTAYYRDVIGLRERKRSVNADGTLRSVWLDASGTVLMIEQREASEASVSEGSMELVSFAAEAGTLRAWEARLGAVEGKTAYTVYARDPDGRRVAVSEYVFEE